MRRGGAEPALYLEEQVRGGFDPLLEQNAQCPVLLLQVKDSGPQLQTLLPQILWRRNDTRSGGEGRACASL